MLQFSQQIVIIIILKFSAIISATQEPHVPQNEDLLSLQIRSIIQNELFLHRFPQKTIWFDTGPHSNQTNKELESILPALSTEGSHEMPPLIIGSFGPISIRKVHTHLTSFIFVAVVVSPKDTLQFISSNGNKRRDRYIFIGEETQLIPFFGSRVISVLKDKIGLIILKSIGPMSLLVDPLVWNGKGQMDKISLDVGSFLIERPLMGRNLCGRHIKISGSLLPTWLYRTSDESSPLGVTHDGSNYRVFLESSHKFNFTFELDAPVGQGYGSLLPNGTWTGMAADLYYTERGFDVAILLGHVPGWWHFVDFASTLDFANLVFVTGRPKLQLSSDAFIAPFQRDVWIAIMALYLVISLSVGILLMLKSWSKKQWSFQEAAYSAISVPYSIALEQALSKVPKNVRFIVSLWLITTIMTGTAYRSNLASFLSVPSVTPVPSTFTQLAADKEYFVVLNNLGVAEAQFFEVSENPVIKEVKRRLGYNPDTVDCAVNAFLKEKTACIAWTPIITTIVWASLTINTALQQPLVQSTEPALPVSMSIGFVKDSVIVDAFTPVTASLYETGVYGKWTALGYHYFKLVGKSNLDKVDKNSELYTKLKQFELSIQSLGTIQPFSVGNFKILFVSLLVGLLVSAIGFMCEISYSRRKKIRRRNDDDKPQIKKDGKIYVHSQLGHLQIQIRSIPY